MSRFEGSGFCEGRARRGPYEIGDNQQGGRGEGPGPKAWARAEWYVERDAEWGHVARGGGGGSVVRRGTDQFHYSPQI